MSFMIEYKTDDAGWVPFATLSCDGPISSKYVYDEAQRVIKAIRNSWKTEPIPAIEDFRVARA